MPPAEGKAYKVGGTVSGLWNTNTVELQNNGTDALTIISVGTFTFPADVADGADYNVTIRTQPVTGQTCAVNNGAGTVSGGPVTTVAVECRSSLKAITSFVFSSPTGTGIIDETAKTISVKVPYGTDAGALTAAFTTMGASVKVDGVEQESGVTQKDFTGPVLYTVTAADGSMAVYTVTVTVAGPLPLIVDNYFLDIAAAASDPPAGWSKTGSGGLTGIVLSTTSGSTYYSRADFDLTNRSAFLLETVASGPALPGVGELGARLWAQFEDPDAPPLPPGAKIRHVEVRFIQEAGFVRKLALYDGISNALMGTITVDWAQTAPRLRIRLKRQQVAGIDYMVLQAEPSSSFDDPANPNPDPDTAASIKAPLSSFGYASGSGSQVGFGNFVAGTYTSDWESIHVTTTDSQTEVLPYWPAMPAAPTLAHIDMGAGVPQAASFQIDLGPSGACLANDVAKLSLTSTSGTDEHSIPDPSNSGGGLINDTFTGLADDQTVTGWVEVCEVSGRCRVGASGSAVIPDRSSP